MGDKSRPVFLMIGGGYLTYTGSRLISEVMKSHPTSENLFIAFGAFFVIFGILIVGANLKKLYDLTKGEKNSDVVVEDIEFPEAIEEAPVQKARTSKKQIKMVNLEASEEKSETTDNENETSEEEAAENEIFDVDESDDEFIETDDEFYDEEEDFDGEDLEEDDEDLEEDDEDSEEDGEDSEEDDEYEEDDECEDDESDDEGQEDTDEESDEDLFKIKLERI